MLMFHISSLVQLLGFWFLFLESVVGLILLLLILGTLVFGVKVKRVLLGLEISEVICFKIGFL